MFVGDLLGEVLGVQANVGGVGVAMILLLLLSNFDSRRLTLSPRESCSEPSHPWFCRGRWMTNVAP